MGILHEFETERLIIKLLTLSQMKLWVGDISILEKELDCKCNRPEGFFLNIVNNQIKTIENDLKNYIYHSFWFIIRKTDKKALGSIDFKNVPNKQKEVEIGYGLGQEFENNGYITETIKGFCKMAFMNENIETVIAETEKENIGSERVLEKNGFKKYKEEKTNWWKLEKK